MRVLGAGLGLIAARRAGIIGLAVALGDIVSRGRKRLFRQAQRVRSHIGDQTDRAVAGDLDALVELLGDRHRAARRHGEAARGLLLQCRGDKGRRGAFLLLSAFDGIDDKGRVLRRGDDGVDLVLALEFGLLLALAVKAGGEGAAAALAVEQRVEQPVLLALESLDLLLAVDDHARRDGLDPSGGEAGLDLFPKQRRDLVADDAVQHAARLLRVDEIGVDRAGIFNALCHDLFRDLVEGHALGFFVAELQQLLEMPGDRLALAVRVRREIDRAGRLGVLFQLCDQILLVLHGDIFRLEAVLYVNAQLALRQIPQMPHGRFYLIFAAEISLDGLGLRRGFDDDQVFSFCHMVSSLCSCYERRCTLRATRLPGRRRTMPLTVRTVS